MTRQKPGLISTKFGAVAMLAIFAFATLTVASRAQSLSLSGTVRRGGDPVVGASLFLRRGQDPQIGPAVTDNYGRYAFYDIPQGSYRLTLIVGSEQKWQGDVTAPGNVPPIAVQ